MSASAGRALAFAHKHKTWIGAYEDLLERGSGPSAEALFGNAADRDVLFQNFEKVYDAATCEVVDAFGPLVRIVEAIGVPGVSVWKSTSARTLRNDWRIEAYARPVSSGDSQPRCTFGVELWPSDDFGLAPVVWLWWKNPESDPRAVLSQIQMKWKDARLVADVRNGAHVLRDWDESTIVTHQHLPKFTSDGRIDLDELRTVIERSFKDLVESGIIAELSAIAFKRSP